MLAAKSCRQGGGTGRKGGLGGVLVLRVECASEAERDALADCLELVLAWSDGQLENREVVVKS